MNLLSFSRKVIISPSVACHAVVDRWLGRALLRAHGVEFGAGLRTQGLPNVSRHPAASIRLGRDVSLNSRTTSNQLYLSRPCTLVAACEGACIEIGDGAALSGATLIARSSIRVGPRTMIGAEVMIMDTDFHPLDPARRAQHPTEGASQSPVTVGADVFIGWRATILKGVTIGDGAVVAAGAVVTRDVAPGAVVGGNPARVLGATGSKNQEETRA